MQIYKRGGFTFFELLIVIFLIGTIYAIVLVNFNLSNNVKITKFENLKYNLQKIKKPNTLLEYYIYDDCSKFAIFIDGEIDKKLTIDFDIKGFENIKVYKNDRDAREKKIEFAPILIDNKLRDVCFKYSIFPNDSSSSFIVELNEVYYVFFPYFQETNVTTKLDQALNVYLQENFRQEIDEEK